MVVSPTGTVIKDTKYILAMNRLYGYLDMTYDPLVDSTRIVFVDDRLPSLSNPDQNREVYAGTLDVNLSFAPNPDGHRPVSDTTWSVENPKIIYNPYYNSNITNSAYISFWRINPSQLLTDRIKAVDLVNPTNETWQTDSSYTDVEGESNDITYRATGDKLVTWINGNKIISNWGGLLQSNSISNQHVVTNRQNQRDHVLGWQDAFDINNDQHDEDILCGKEILP
jgi:hypothetical protein